MKELFDKQFNKYRYPFNREDVPNSLRFLLTQDNDPTKNEVGYDLTRYFPFILYAKSSRSNFIKVLEEQGKSISYPSVVSDIRLRATGAHLSHGGNSVVLDAVGSDIMAEAVNFLIKGTVNSLSDKQNQTPLPTVCFSDIYFGREQGMITLNMGSKRPKYIWLFNKLVDWTDPERPNLNDGILTGGVYLDFIPSEYRSMKEEFVKTHQNNTLYISTPNHQHVGMSNSTWE